MKRFPITIFIILFIFMSFCPSFAARKALLIGIADYRALPSSSKQGISDLRGSINDVREIKRALISYYGFAEKDVRVLINDKATRRDIKAAFDEWLVKGTRAGDTALLYFSGHGSTVDDQNGDEKDGLDEVLCPYDMVPKGGDNIILDDELGLWLKKLNGRRLVVIFDSCYSGGATRSIGGSAVSILEDTPARRSRFIPITNYQPSSIALGRSRGADVPEPVIFMAASRENEIALEVRLPDGFHGGFTFGLCDGMKASPTSSYERLFDHARKVVKDRLKLAQEPQLVAERDIVVEPAFKDARAVTSPEQGDSEPVTRPEQTSTQPVTPPEIVGETVLVALDTLSGTSHEEMRELRKGLARLPIVDIVETDAFFDCLVRGEKKKGRYHVRLINGIGDVDKVKPVASMNELVQQLNAHLEYACMVKQLARIHHPSPPFKVKAWVTDENRRDFKIGENIVFGVKSERDCHILLINLDGEGNFHIIFPNQYHQDNFIRVNTTVLIPDEAMSRGEFQLQFGPPAGEETVKLIATTEPLNLRNLGLGDFKQSFQEISGGTRTTFVRGVLNNLSSNRFAWSEDTIVIRSHEVRKP